MFRLDLQWKEFNVDLAALDTQLRATYANYAGNQAAAGLELWFSEEPTEQEKTDIQALWDGLTAQSALAQSYQTAAQIKTAADTDKAAKVASAMTKLTALGLTEAEVLAIIG